MRTVFRIDEEGYLLEAIPLNDGEVTPLDCVEVIPDGEVGKSFHKYKWDGEKWVEGLTIEELEDINNQPPLLTEEQKLIQQLQQENKLLKAQAQANADRADFHEEVLTEIILAINP